jgi:hypothetical protein
MLLILLGLGVGRKNLRTWQWVMSNEMAGTSEQFSVLWVLLIDGCSLDISEVIDPIWVHTNCNSTVLTASTALPSLAYYGTKTNRPEKHRPTKRQSDGYLWGRLECLGSSEGRTCPTHLSQRRNPEFGATVSYALGNKLYIAATLLGLVSRLRSVLLCEESRPLGYEDPVRTSQETHYVFATGSSRLTLCKIWGFHGGDDEECRLLGYKTQFVPHRIHITSPLHSTAS